LGIVQLKKPKIEMKLISNYFLQLLLIGVLVVTGCTSDKKSERRIAELEARLQELEGSRNSPTITRDMETNPAPVNNEEAPPEGPLPAISFAKMDHDFGSINEGDVVEHVFTFTNTGEAPLIIQNAQGSCGCTVPDFTKKPIPVGETGEIRVKFDSKGRKNIQNKSVTVTANTWPKQTFLRLKSNVIPKEDASQMGGGR